MSELLLESHDIGEWLSLLGGYILRRAQSNAFKSNKSAAWASEKLLRHPHENLLKLIREELKLSERSLERMFRTNIGMSPKLFSRICRLRHHWPLSGTVVTINYLISLMDMAMQTKVILYANSASSPALRPILWLKKATEYVENYPEWKIWISVGFILFYPFMNW